MVLLVSFTFFWIHYFQVYSSSDLSFETFSLSPILYQCSHITQSLLLLLSTSSALIDLAYFLRFIN